MRRIFVPKKPKKTKPTEGRGPARAWDGLLHGARQRLKARVRRAMGPRATAPTVPTERPTSLKAAKQRKDAKNLPGAGYQGRENFREIQQTRPLIRHASSQSCHAACPCRQLPKPPHVVSSQSRHTPYRSPHLPRPQPWPKFAGLESFSTDVAWSNQYGMMKVKANRISYHVHLIQHSLSLFLN